MHYMIKTMNSSLQHFEFEFKSGNEYLLMLLCRP